LGAGGRGVGTEEDEETEEVEEEEEEDAHIKGAGVSSPTADDIKLSEAMAATVSVEAPVFGDEAVGKLACAEFGDKLVPVAGDNCSNARTALALALARVTGDKCGNIKCTFAR